MLNFTSESNKMWHNNVLKAVDQIKRRRTVSHDEITEVCLNGATLRLLPFMCVRSAFANLTFAKAA